MKSNVVEKFNQDSSSTEKVFQRNKKPKLDWVGGLSKLRGQYTALELHKVASSLRVEWTLKPTRERKARSEVVK